MRSRKASASYGTLNRRMRLTHETILLAVMALFGLWMIVSLIQAIALNQSLGSQANDLRRQNAALQTTNDSYRRDIAAVSSGAAAEEEARQNGYARGDEKVYVISTPPPPPAPRPQPRPSAGLSGPLGALWHLLTGLPPA
jgi:cell division protein FtsB